MTLTRNRIGKKDDLETVLTKLEGQRDAKERWRYTRQARHVNLAIGILQLQKQLEERLNEDLQS